MGFVQTRGKGSPKCRSLFLRDTAKPLGRVKHFTVIGIKQF